MPKHLRKWNDLAHAAAWLTEQTGESWEALDLANAGSPAGLRLYVHFRFPPGYELPPDQPPALVEGCMTEIRFHNDLERLTQTDEIPLHLLKFGEGENGGYLKFPPGTLRTTLDEIRVKEADLVEFLASVKSRKGAGEVDATPSIAWDAMTPEQKIAAWKDMEAPMRRAKALELFREFGTYEAAGREVGVTGKRISQLVLEAEEAEAATKPKSKKPPLPAKSRTGPFGLSQPKRFKTST